jgi:hypothetical protein
MIIGIVLVDITTISTTTTDGRTDGRKYALNFRTQINIISAELIAIMMFQQVA